MARRGTVLVLIFLTLAVLVSLTALVATWVVIGAGPSVAANTTLRLRLAGPIGESEPGGLIGQFLDVPPTVRTVIDQLRKAKVDRRIRSVVFQPGDIETLWGKSQELRSAILDFKRSGKPVVAYLEFADDQEYYVATACDRIYLTPSSPLDLNGVASYELFFRGLLDKIGAYPDLLHIGDYKTAANTFTETGFTPAHREMAESMTGDLYDQIIRGIAEGRRLEVDEVRGLLDQGPFLPEDALRVGLVDDVAYEDQIDDRMEAVSDEQWVEFEDYLQIGGRTLGLDRGPRIAIVNVDGIIASGDSSGSPDGGVVGSDTILEYLRTARADRSIRAVILRIDSPGGSAVASDVIWREVVLTRRSKPVVASMSDVAASGGYYVAVGADTIVAQPATLTGSIGVVMGKILTGGTFGKLGITIESVSRGRFADINSPLRPYSPQERAKMEAQMQATYDLFVEKAAEGRRLAPERIDELGRGRVWTGRQARDLGLVDELGGLDRALAVARKRAGIAPEAEVELVIYPPRKTFYELVANPFGALDAYATAQVTAAAPEWRAAARLLAPALRFRAGEPLALVPFGVMSR